ncbi:MAG: DUF1778 domain-containing protein [Terracidiphilus sp.]
MAEGSIPNKVEKRRARDTRLGFRVDAETRRMVERAAALERRSMTDFCMTVLLAATRETIVRHETLVLTEQEREIFFDALVNPPEPNERLRRAYAEAKRTISA